MKYPALNPSVNLKIRYEELTDIDYFDKLPPDAKEFMNSFLEESVNANFNHKGKILHKTQKQRRACYTKNNKRNADIFSRVRSQGKLISFADLKETNDTSRKIEDLLIYRVDKNKK